MQLLVSSYYIDTGMHAVLARATLLQRKGTCGQGYLWTKVPVQGYLWTRVHVDISNH